MKRIVIMSAALLVSALGAQASPLQGPYHPAYRSAVSNGAGIPGLPTAAMPPGFRAVFDDAIDAIQHGSAHPAAHNSACMARQARLADDIERLAPSGGPVDVSRNPAVIELRTRCMPVNPYPDDW